MQREVAIFDLGFRVWDFRDLGFRVQGLGFRVLGFRVFGATNVSCYQDAQKSTNKS